MKEKDFIKSRPLVRQSTEDCLRTVFGDCEDIFIDLPSALTALRAQVDKDIANNKGKKEILRANLTAADYNAISRKEFIARYDAQTFPVGSGI